MDDIHLAWMKIVLLGRKSAVLDEYRSHRMNIICCHQKSSVVDKNHPI
jgi:hypothetical protein